MTNKHYKGNEMIRRLVVGCRFRLFSTWYCCSIPNMVKKPAPHIFDKATKITFFVANVAVPRRILLSPPSFMSEDWLLQVTKRTLYLAAATTFCFFYLLKILLGHGERCFLQHYLRHNILSVSHHKPTRPAQITKVFPLKGRNSRTVPSL